MGEKLQVKDKIAAWWTGIIIIYYLMTTIVGLLLLILPSDLPQDCMLVEGCAKTDSEKLTNIIIDFTIVVTFFLLLRNLLKGKKWAFNFALIGFFIVFVRMAYFELSNPPSDAFAMLIFFPILVLFNELCWRIARHFLRVAS